MDIIKIWLEDLSAWSDILGNLSLSSDAIEAFESLSSAFQGLSGAE